MVSIMMTVAIVIAVFAIFNMRALSKIVHFGKSQAGKIGRAAEQLDPINQMREAAEEAKDQVTVAREALIKNKALKDSLERQVARNKVEIARAENKLKKYKEENRTKTDPEVIKAAEQLAQARNDLAVNEKQLEIQATLYSNTMESARKAVVRITSIEQRAANLEARLDTSKAQAELAEMLNAYNPASVNGAVGKAEKFADFAESQIAQNQAKLQVNNDLGITVADDEDSIAVSTAASSILDEFETPKCETPKCETPKCGNCH